MSKQHDNRRVRLARLTASGAALALAADAAAQTASMSLDQMVVTGSREPARISELPSTVWVVDAAQIQEQVRGGLPLKEALGVLIPSLDVASLGRTNFGQNMRGRSVLVMIDGVSLNSARGISRQFDSIDPFNIARIEVISGATSVYGGGATGGIINIITKRGQADTRFTSQIGASSGFNDSDDYQVRAAQSISGGSERLQGRLGLAAQKNGGAFDADGDQIIPDITQTDLQYNRSLDMMGSLDADLGNGQSLSATAQIYDSRFDGDTGVYFGENLGALTGADPDSLEVRDGFSADREPASRRSLLTATYYNPDVLGQEFFLQGYGRREELSFSPFPYIAGGTAYFSASEQNTDVYGLKALFVTHLDSVQLKWGLDSDRESFNADQMLFDRGTSVQSGGLRHDRFAVVGRYPDIKSRTIAGFLQGDWNAAERLRVSAGIRQQRTKIEVSDFVGSNQQVLIAYGFADSADSIPGGSNDYDVTLVNLGAVFELNGASQLWAGFSQGYEIPDPAKYYGQGTYQLVDGHYQLTGSVNVDDSPLKGIKTDQIELGWRYAGKRLATQVATYYAWSDEAVTFDRSTLAVRVEGDKTRNYGIEGNVAYRVSAAWQVGGSAHWVRSERENGSDWERQRIDTASVPKATAFVGWNASGTSVRLQLARSFDLKDDDGGKIDGYHVLDLLGHRVLPVGTLSFGIQNLLNEDYTTIWGQRAQALYSSFGPAALFDYSGQGRTYSLTYTVDY